MKMPQCVLLMCNLNVYSQCVLSYYHPDTTQTHLEIYIVGNVPSNASYPNTIQNSIIDIELPGDIIFDA